MPLQSIIVIFLRLFGVQFFFTSLVSVTTLWSAPWRMLAFSSISWMIAAVLCSFFAEPLARLATKGYDAPVNLGGLTRRDLYCFAFVFVGLGLLLPGLAGSLFTMGVAIADATEASGSRLDHSVMSAVTGQLPRYAMQSIIGLFAVLFANRFAKMLTASEK